MASIYDLPIQGASPPYTINFVPRLLTKWRAARAKVIHGTADAAIAFCGDSTMRGQGSASTTAQALNAWPVKLATMLNAGGVTASAHNLFGTGNATLSSFDSRVTLTGSFTTTSVSVGGFLFRMATTANIAFLPTSNCSTFDVYSVNNGTGQFTINCNGGATKATVNTTTAGSIVKTTVTETLGANTLNIVWSSGTPYILGVDCWDSASKTVRCWNMGWLGSTTSNWGSVSTLFAPPGALQSYLTPDLTIIDLGINDWTPTEISLTNYRNRLQTLITAAKTNGDVILKTPIPSDTSVATVDSQSQYVRIMYELATLNNLPLVDVWSMWGSYSEANALGYYNDTKHGSGAGYADEARLMANLLLQV